MKIKLLIFFLSLIFLFPPIVSAVGKPVPPPSSTKVVVLDPGHGGSDSGAVYNSLREADVNLDIAFRLKTLLENAGYTVFMTRIDDSTKNNNDRYTFANSVGGNALVSIHLNASTDHSVNGTQGFWGKKNKDETFTRTVHQALASQLGVNDRGVTNFPSGVLLKSNMPSTLQETVFISNDVENAKLQDGTGNRQQEIAQALFQGIDNWFGN